MLTWMLYVIVVSALLSMAALLAERGARLSRVPSRWIWTVTIVTSLLIPSVIASVTIQVPNISVQTARVQKILPLREMTSTYLSPAQWVAPYIKANETWRHSDDTVKHAWWLASYAMLFALLASGLHLFLRKRRWMPHNMMGTPVYVATDVGPAVVGLLRPRIVIPQWLTQSPQQQQAAVLAHELSHLKAGDQRLLTIALALLVFMPWNLPLWWQLRRLRYAIEVDCDSRVVDAGHDVRDYSETLIAMGERQSAFIGAVAAMSESKSFLQERIEIMLYQPIKWWRVAAIAFACMSFGFAAIAAQVSPPNSTTAAATPTSGAQKEIALDTTVLDRYVGTYRIVGNALVTVTREGEQLFVQLTGQSKSEVYPSAESEFFYKAVNAQITFVRDSGGQTTGLVIHQNGQNIPASHMDAATADQIGNSLAAKIKNQKPTPGSEEALRRMLAGIESNNPNYDEMSPQLAQATKQTLPTTHAMSVGFGPVASIQFKGVGNQGWDVYDVHHQNGVAHWRLMLSDDGKIASAVVISRDVPVAEGP